MMENKKVIKFTPQSPITGLIQLALAWKYRNDVYSFQELEPGTFALYSYKRELVCVGAWDEILTEYRARPPVPVYVPRVNPLAELDIVIDL